MGGETGHQPGLVAGASVAGSVCGMPPWVAEALSQIRQATTTARGWWRRNGRTSLAVAAKLALAVTVVLIAISLWLVVSAYRGLPDDEAIRRIGEMDQATAVFDSRDQLAFTIFKEQRIEVPLAEVSPHLDAGDHRDRGPAVLRASRLRRASASASAALANVRRGARGAGRQHDHAAARAPELPHARQDAIAASSRS